MTTNERAYRNRQMGAGLVKDQIRGKIELLDNCIKDAESEISQELQELERIAKKVQDGYNDGMALLDTEDITKKVRGYREQIQKFNFAKKVLNEVLENK